MGFVQVFTFLASTPPGRFYVHTAGFEKVFGNKDCSENYIVDVLDKHKKRFEGWYSFLLGTVWGDESNGDRVIDLFGYKCLKEWSGNPDVDLWVIRNGVYVPGVATTCEDTLFVLGKEREHRKMTKSLEEYMISSPKFCDLELSVEYNI